MPKTKSLGNYANDGWTSARATGLPTTAIPELRSRLLRPVPCNDSKRLRETLGLLFHVYDDTWLSSRGCSVNGYKFLCNGNRTLHCSAGNAFRHLVGHWHEFRWLGQRADFVHWELEGPCTCSACSQRPSLEIQSTQCSSSWRCVGKAHTGHQKNFYDILETIKLTEEVLVTTFCLVEQSLDLEALAPNHFLLGHRAIPFLPLDFEQNFNHWKRYARAQSCANSIWSRWLREYVPMLNKRAKWFSSPESHLKTGDLV